MLARAASSHALPQTKDLVRLLAFVPCRRGICHGDVYAHNVMASEEGHATLCDYGASFAYHKGGAVPYEAQEVRAFGLMLADMVQRLDIDFHGELGAQHTTGG